MRRWIGVAALGCVLAMAGVRQAAAAAKHKPPVKVADPADIQSAIDKAKAYLYAKQTPEGNWENVQHPPKTYKGSSVNSGQWGSQTAIATYALLASGENPQDPRLVKAIEFLETADLQGTYAVCMRAQVWAFLPPEPALRPLVRRDAMWLLAAMKHAGKSAGFYEAVANPRSLEYDHRMSQYGVLGMRACVQAGYEASDDYWRAVQLAWRRDQLPDGSWNYAPLHTTKPNDLKPWASMTAAGMACLLVTQDQLTSESAECRGNAVNPYLDKATDWMDQHLKGAIDNPQALFDLERIGDSSGRKYYGTDDWYQMGAKMLLGNQQPDGSFQLGPKVSMEDTCFGLLFLAWGRAPVLMNKLDYSDDEHPNVPWNERPRDLAHLTAWVAKEAELGKFLNWQFVNLDAPVDELHDAPVIYIAGNQALELSEEEEAKLREFVEQGGMLLFNADCDNDKFTDSVKKLGARLFPIPGEFRDLPADHPIYKAEQFPAADWKEPPKLLGLTNGVRELMLLVPSGDVSHAWETSATSTHASSFELAADIFLYAVDKQHLHEKGDTFILKPDKAIKPDRTIKVARLEVGDTWDPEPGGWRRLAVVMHNLDHVKLEIQSVKPGEGNLSAFKIAHLTGTAKPRLSEQAGEELKKFVENGGTLIIDAAGGSPQFAAGVEPMLSAMFPGEELKTLPPDHLLYTSIDGPLEKTGFRQYALRHLQLESRAPQIKGIDVGKRVGVFYSALDLTGGLVGEPVDGVLGYDPETATALMERMVLYADSGGQPVASHAPAPSPKKSAPPPAPPPAPASPATQPAETSTPPAPIKSPTKSKSKKRKTAQ